MIAFATGLVWFLDRSHAINITLSHFRSAPLSLLSNSTMPGLVSSARPLPADLAITERSRRFYDGTYRWDSDGFTDEQGGKERTVTR
jgi:hypothetical protein